MHQLKAVTVETDSIRLWTGHDVPGHLSVEHSHALSVNLKAVSGLALTAHLCVLVY